MPKFKYEDRKALGNMIRDKRKAQAPKLSQQDLADKIKTADGVMNEGYLSYIESGQKIPSMEIVEQIAKVLNFTDEELKMAQKFVLYQAAQKIFANSSSTLAIDKIVLIHKK